MEKGGEHMYVDRAVAWFMTAIEQGNTFAACALAKLYVSQERHRNIPEAIKLFESAANENSAAAYSLGMLYLKGESGDRDVDKAIEWFNQSAQMGNPYAQYMLDHINDGAEQNLGCAIISLFAQLGKTMNNRTDGSHASGIDRKLAREIIEKERSLGQKADLAQRYQGME